MTITELRLWWGCQGSSRCQTSVCGAFCVLTPHANAFHHKLYIVDILWETYSGCKIATCDPVHSLLVQVSRSNADAGTFAGMMGYFKTAMATTCPRVTVLSVINKNYLLLWGRIGLEWCTRIYTCSICAACEHSHIYIMMHEQPFSNINAPDFCTGTVTIMTGFTSIPGLMPEYYLAVGSNILLLSVLCPTQSQLSLHSLACKPWR